MVALYWSADILAAHNAKTARLFRASITKAGCLLCIVGYIPLSQNVFSVLLCTELYGKYYLSASLGSQCYVGEHNAYFAMGIIFVVVYCVGIPLGYVLACRRCARISSRFGCRLLLAHRVSVRNSQKNDEWRGMSAR